MMSTADAIKGVLLGVSMVIALISIGGAIESCRQGRFGGLRGAYARKRP